MAEVLHCFEAPSDSGVIACLGNLRVSYISRKKRDMLLSINAGRRGEPVERQTHGRFEHPSTLAVACTTKLPDLVHGEKWQGKMCTSKDPDIEQGPKSNRISSRSVKSVTRCYPRLRRIRRCFFFFLSPESPSGYHTDHSRSSNAPSESPRIQCTWNLRLL